MKIEHNGVLRAALERMDTPQLDEMLLEELRKDEPNGELIRLISNVLRERDRDKIPEIDDHIRQAWEQYQQKRQPIHTKPKPITGFLLKAASVLLVLFTLLAIMPQEANAMNFFERFIAWTEDVFSLISPAESRQQAEAYVFRTENPGLQEVYDKVVELGVTVPVVPMWIPEGYELTECKITETLSGTYLSASFFLNGKELVYQLNVYSDNITSKYYKDGTDIRIEEKDGIKYTIVCNEELSVAIWSTENLECTISLDCPEEILIRIIDAIYTMEVS